MLLIAVNKMIHFHLNHLFNMIFLNVVRSKIKNNAQCTNSENAKCRQRYSNTIAQTTLYRESVHEMSDSNQDHERSQLDRNRQP